MDYRAAGVDIAAADDAKERIKRLLSSRKSASVLSEIGSFGGVFQPDFSGLKEPVLVSSTDGVGTKIRIARDCGVHDTVGYDLVAHCVNDILVQGAKPLFFLDYIALGKMDPARVESIVSGIARACAEFSCPLIGGETAEMPGTYAEDDYDLAGFIVGAMDKAKVLPRKDVGVGDVLIGLPSLGLHTNGYSLARKVLLERMGLRVSDRPASLPGTVGEALLAPHRSYLEPLWPELQQDRVKALVHITGGGFEGNIPRVLPSGVGARVVTSAWPVLPIFQLIAEGGPVARDEMFRTFNMGIGMILVVAPGAAEQVESSLRARGETCYRIGELVAGDGVTLV
ncbi:MAG TPA: phosphoribosylformylglycinamidine cyclo-ligase [Vicinamibacteria bacterium]|nr:phosphoribosylformylglycinamidine cyclo-ligase [Vicinamibacteria bacterium]